MSEVIYARGAGGTILQFDEDKLVGFARERFDEQVAKGDLAIVTDPVEWVERADGSRHLQLTAAAAQPKSAEQAAPKKRRSKAAADQVPSEPATESEPADAGEGDEG